MGAVIVYDPEIQDTAHLLPPEGRSFGSDMADQIVRFLDDLKGQAMIAYATKIRAEGGTFDRNCPDFVIGTRANIARTTIPDVMFPRKLVMQAGTTIPDFYANFGFFFVSDAFKSLVESFDGDLHQFVPVEIVDDTGADYAPSHYYCFRSRQVLNAIDDSSEHLTDPGNSRAKPGGLGLVSLSYGHPFRMFKDKIGHAGIWRELRSPNNLFASEAFLQKAKDRQITGLHRLTDFDEI